MECVIVVHVLIGNLEPIFICFLSLQQPLGFNSRCYMQHQETGLDISSMVSITIFKLLKRSSNSQGTWILIYRYFETYASTASNLLKPSLGRGELQEDAVRILMGLQEKYETRHRCKYILEAINAVVYLLARYIPDRYLPDKAIDLIDKAGSRARMESFRKKKEQQVDVLSKFTHRLLARS